MHVVPSIDAVVLRADDNRTNKNAKTADTPRVLHRLQSSVSFGSYIYLFITSAERDLKGKAKENALSAPSPLPRESTCSAGFLFLAYILHICEAIYGQQ